MSGESVLVTAGTRSPNEGILKDLRDKVGETKGGRGGRIVFAED